MGEVTSTRFPLISKADLDHASAELVSASEKSGHLQEGWLSAHIDRRHETNYLRITKSLEAPRPESSEDELSVDHNDIEEHEDEVRKQLEIHDGSLNYHRKHPRLVMFVQLRLSTTSSSPQAIKFQSCTSTSKIHISCFRQQWTPCIGTLFPSSSRHRQRALGSLVGSQSR